MFSINLLISLNSGKVDSFLEQKAQTVLMMMIRWKPVVAGQRNVAWCEVKCKQEMVSRFHVDT